MATWWWAKVTRTKIATSNKSSLAVLLEPACSYIVNSFPKKEIKCYLALFAFCIIAQELKGGMNYFTDKLTLKMKQCEELVPDAHQLLLCLQGSPLQQRQLRGEQQVRGGAKLAPNPSVKARHMA